MRIIYLNLFYFSSFILIYLHFSLFLTPSLHLSSPIFVSLHLSSFSSVISISLYLSYMYFYLSLLQYNILLDLFPFIFICYYFSPLISPILIHFHISSFIHIYRHSSPSVEAKIFHFGVIWDKICNIFV